jgi:hypothetical protein
VIGMTNKSIGSVILFIGAVIVSFNLKSDIVSFIFGIIGMALILFGNMVDDYV